MGCYSLSNPIEVTRNEAVGGTISTTDPTTICIDGTGDPIDVTLTGNVGQNSQWVITDPNGVILDLPAAPPFDLDGAGPGVCIIWHLSYSDGLTGAIVGNNANTDLMGCYALSNPIEVIRTEISASVVVDNITCNGDNNGAINLTVTGGSGYMFEWSNGDMTEDISGLAPDDYSVTVMDASGCETVLGPYTISEPSTLVVTLDNTTPSTGNDGAIDLTTTGGVMPYSYIWDDGVTTTEDRTGLAVGYYTVTVTDAGGCTLVVGPINVPMPVSIDEIEGLSIFNVYPNPASSYTQIELAFASTTDIRLEIINVLGQVIYEQNETDVEQAIYPIDTQSYPSGIYFVRISTPENQAHELKRLIIE